LTGVEWDEDDIGVVEDGNLAQVKTLVGMKVVVDYYWTMNWYEVKCC
jgi:hypothetical protein